jgi:phosphopantothenoylcysteine decarboxylase/phosphopantothenate--cysteine ligase
MSTLSGKPVISEFFTANTGQWNSHVDLGLWADAMVIAPATASTIGKMAHGIADNMLLTTYLSMKAPVFVAPAMDLDMYAHPATQANLKCLRERGNIVIEAANGELASHLVGKGRMQEPEHIMNVLDNYFAAVQPLKGRRILITAGPTYERIDPVRFIGNFSTGKMGFALAEACVQMGASVELLSGPVALPTQQGARRHDVTSAQEMLKAAQELFPQCDAAILCAAVADYRPSEQSDTKIKRKGAITLELTPNPDIARDLGQQKRSDQVMVGFALETNAEEQHALEKLEKKNLDLIVLNSLRNEGTCFRSDENQVSIISRNGQHDYDRKPKQNVARDIIDELEKRLGV